MKTEVSNNEGTDTSGGCPGKSRPKAQRVQSQHHHRLLGDQQSDVQPASDGDGPGLHGILLPLLQPMLRIGVVTT